MPGTSEQSQHVHSHGCDDTRQQCTDTQKQRRAIVHLKFVQTGRRKVVRRRDWIERVHRLVCRWTLSEILRRNHSLFWCLCLCSGVLMLEAGLSSYGSSDLLRSAGEDQLSYYQDERQSHIHDEKGIARE